MYIFLFICTPSATPLRGPHDNMQLARRVGEEGPGGGLGVGRPSSVPIRSLQT